MYRFEGTEIKMLVFSTEAFLKKHLFLPHFYPLLFWEVYNFRTVNNKHFYGSPKDQNLVLMGKISEINIDHTEKKESTFKFL